VVVLPEVVLEVVVLGATVVGKVPGVDVTEPSSPQAGRASAPSKTTTRGRRAIRRTIPVPSVHHYAR
jgi:hypothetical protein